MLTQEEINKIRQDAGVAPLGQTTRPSLSSRLGISVSPKIAGLQAEAETARLEAERAESFGGMAKEFGKEFVKQAGEISGIVPTGKRIAAGIAPYVVPETELPAVVEELVGGVEGKKKMGATGELAQKIGLPESVAEGIDVAVDLPLISLGLSKNISKFLGEQAGKSAPELAKMLNKPLTEFLPEGLKKIGQTDIGKPIRETAEKVEKFLGKKIEASRLIKIEKINKQTDEIVGRIIQGKPEDITQAKRALGNIDTEGVKTFRELKEAMEDKTASLASKLDDYLDEQDLRLGSLKPSELAIETKVGERIIRQDFVSDALKQLNELYKTIKDAPSQARILDLHKKLTTEGLNRKEINNLAREYGREFSDKAFTKIGEPLTSVNAQAFENTRKGIKKTVRQNVEGDVPKMLDEQMSDLIETEKLVGKMEEKANTLYQKVKKRGILEKGARKLADIVNLATFNTIHGFISRMLPSNVGLKTMNSLDIQQELGKNLIKLEKLLKTTDDKVLLEGLIDFVKNPKMGMSIEDVSKKGSGTLPSPAQKAVAEGKTVEEFIKEQGTPFYHGTQGDFEVFNKVSPTEGLAGKAGTYFTTNPTEASGFGKNIKETYISPNAKIKIEYAGDMSAEIKAERIFKARKDGYDAIQLKSVQPLRGNRAELAKVNEDIAKLKPEIDKLNERMLAGEITPEQNLNDPLMKKWSELLEKRNPTHTIVFNTDVLKTKSQLIKAFEEAKGLFQNK